MSSACGKIILPGLEATDAFVLFGKTDEHEGVDCPLTMEPLNGADDAQFLLECVKNTDKNSANAPDATWTKLKQDDFSDLANMGGIQILKCGHKFGGVAFMYEIMTKKFKCPICRGGSVNEVTLDRSQTPRDVPVKTWDTLCLVAAQVRENDHIQRIMEESHGLSNIMAVVPIFEIYHTLPWRIAFSIYRSEHPPYNERPYMVVPIPMRVDSDLSVHDDENASTEDVTIRSGE